MDEINNTYYCEKCGRTMGGDQFYRSNNLEKYPNQGRMNVCKKCMTMHVNNWEPETYLWILEEMDVPYVPDEWNKLLTRYGKNTAKLTGTTILGRYLSVMKLGQWMDYRWKDTDFLQEVANSKIEQAMKRQGYDAQQIAEAISKSAVPAPEKPPELIQATTSMSSNIFEDENDLGLTDEDRQYLRLKWGKNYKPEEWVWLEQLYNEMLESYDIQTAGHLDTLKLICKTSLKSNQLLDIGDIDGSQKAVKMYDSLMRSGKFTAAQNKAENGEFVDSVGELVAICEKDGFIPRYYIDEPNDKVDRVLQDMQGYTTDLVMGETNLNALLEKAINEIQAQKEKEADMDTGVAGDEDDLLEQELFEQPESDIHDEDFEELFNMEDEQAEADDEYLQNLLKDGELK